MRRVSTQQADTPVAAEKAYKLYGNDNYYQ